MINFFLRAKNQSGHINCITLAHETCIRLGDSQDRWERDAQVARGLDGISGFLPAEVLRQRFITLFFVVFTIYFLSCIQNWGIVAGDLSDNHQR